CSSDLALRRGDRAQISCLRPVEGRHLTARLLFHSRLLAFRDHTELQRDPDVAYLDLAKGGRAAMECAGLGPYPPLSMGLSRRMARLLPGLGSMAETRLSSLAGR